MKEEDIVKKVCEIMGVKYSHYDNHKMGVEYFEHHNLKSIPKIVVYGSSHGAWQFAILEDMSIITSMTPFMDTLMEVINLLGDFDNVDEEKVKHYESILSENKNTKLSEKFLKDNDCSVVINDVNKKINWV